MKCNKHQDKIFSDSQLRSVCFQMAQGLKFMKNRSIIHCDMKPENVIFTDDRYQ